MALKSSRSPRSARSSTDRAEKYDKGTVQTSQRAIRKDGGPENAGAWEQSSPLSMEDVNGPAAPSRRSATKGV
jgi:hypothetical protein